MPLETLFLDAGGVLVFPDWQRVSETLGRHGVQATSAQLSAAEPHAKRVIDDESTIARTTDQQRGWHYFSLILTHLGIPLSPMTDRALTELRAFHQKSNLWSHVPDEVVPALQALRGSGLRLVVVSNANGTLERLFDRVGLTPHVDFLFDSCNEGVEKPDPRLFEIALARSGASPESTAHVGDLYYIDVVGARAAGLRSALVDAADLYGGFDCPRVSSMRELADALQEDRFGWA